jgi:predicted CxxxxCH...CXXCH cytochrome family protein
LGPLGETLTSEPAVGAHQRHLHPSTSHREGQCVDCHVVPISGLHSDGVTTLTWGALATADLATPEYSFAALTSAGVYCHGATLLGPKAGASVARTPTWTQVDGSFGACGTACHTNPPGSNHPPSTDCPSCHAAVIAAFDSATSAAVWVDAGKHVDGEVQSNAP